MPFNGNGVYVPPSLPGSFNPAQLGQAATPADWNTLLADISTALSTTITSDGQSVISQNIPFNAKRITGLGDPVDAQDAATKNYVLANPRSYIAGLTLSRSSATVLGIAAGSCVNSTNVTGITLAAFTKSTAGTWASGSGSNGMGTGLIIANSTWYHVFAIINAGTPDVYFDTSVSAANAPASTTAFRRIGSFRTNGSAQIIDFVQDGDLFQWKAPVLADVNASNPTTSAVTRTLTVPTGVNVTAMFQGGCVTTEIGTLSMPYFSDLDTDDTAVSTTFMDVPNTVNATGGVARSFGRFGVRTNTSAQIRTRVGTGSTANVNLIINTLGWIDSRGRNA